MAQPSPGRAEFTQDEQAVIVRNQALAVAVTIDPNVVRQILDEMAKPGPRRPRSILEEGKDVSQGEIDPTRNPDLDVYMQRASPEAAYDLLQILKRVGAVGGAAKR